LARSSSTAQSTMASSKSPPPRRESPEVAMTSILVWSTVMI